MEQGIDEIWMTFMFLQKGLHVSIMGTEVGMTGGEDRIVENVWLGKKKTRISQNCLVL